MENIEINQIADDAQIFEENNDEQLPGEDVATYWARFIRHHGNDLRQVPHHLLTTELIMVALNDDVLAFYDLDVPDITYDICKYAISRRWDILGSTLVINHFITRELCEIAFAQDESAIVYIPEEMQTPEMYELIVRKKSKQFHHVPDSIKTPEMCMSAVDNDGRALRGVPSQFINAELCVKAVTTHYKAIFYVPIELLTEEIWMIAFCYPPTHIKIGKTIETKIKYRLKRFDWATQRSQIGITLKFCEALLDLDGMQINCIPDQFQNHDTYIRAIRQNALAITKIPVEQLTFDICEALVMKDGSMLKYIVEKVIPLKNPVLTKQLKNSPEVEELAVRQNGLALQYVKTKSKTKKICDIALAQNPCAIKFVPATSGIITVARGIAALRADGNSVKFMTDKMKCNILINDWNNIQYFPPECQTIDVLIVVVKCALNVAVF